LVEVPPALEEVLEEGADRLAPAIHPRLGEVRVLRPLGMLVQRRERALEIALIQGLVGVSQGLDVIAHRRFSGFESSRTHLSQVVFTMITEYGALWETLFGTLPSTRLCMPLLPTTSTSEPCCSAMSHRTSAGSPSRASLATST